MGVDLNINKEKSSNPTMSHVSGYSIVTYNYHYRGKHESNDLKCKMIYRSINKGDNRYLIDPRPLLARLQYGDTGTDG